MMNASKALSFFCLVAILASCQAAPPTGTPQPSSQPSVQPGPGQDKPEQPASLPTGSPAPGGQPGMPSAPPPSPVPSAAESPVAPVSVDLGDVQINLDTRFLNGAGDSVQIQVVAKDQAGHLVDPKSLALEFTSSRPQDVSVDAQGLIKALQDFGYSEIGVRVPGSEQTAKFSISVSSSEAVSGSSGGGGSSSFTASLSSVTPTSAKIGDEIVLSGSHLSSVSKVTLDGFEAKITSQSASEVHVLIPAEALSGTIQVQAGSRTLSSSIALKNRVWFVDDTATGANDGSSWTDAFTDLQTALTQADPGDAIWVAEGRYTPDSSDRTVYFMLADGTQLYGGFVGNESFAADRDIANHETVLSGDLNGDDVYGALPFTNPNDNSLNILRHGEDALIDGVVIEGGYANMIDDLPNAEAAGIYSGDYKLTLRNSILRNNYSVNKAGAWYNGAGNAEISNVTFLRDGAGGSGGGALWNESGNLNFSDVTFDSCVNPGGGGGAIRNQNALNTPDMGNLTFTNATFQNNQANGGGGAGINNQGGDLSLSNARFDNGQATGAGGSAIISSAGTLTLDHVDFSNNTHSLGALKMQSGTLKGSYLNFTDNTATSPGGGINANSVTATLDHVVFDNDDATGGPGGGINLSSGSLSISHGNFTNCDATGGPGGGIYAVGDSVNLKDVTFDHNTTTSPGGGLYALTTTLSLKQTKFTHNSSVNPGGGAYFSGTSATISGAQFVGNSSEENNGGGLFLSVSSGTFENLIFANNTSVDPGGGLFVSISNPFTISNAVFANNTASAESGGGIYSGGSGDMTLDHVSFSDNTATNGHAIFSSSSNLTLNNSIVWDNEATPINLNGHALTAYHSIIKDLGSYSLESGSSGNLSSDPEFVNVSDPDGNDNLFATSDDGLMIAPGSPAQNLVSGSDSVKRDIVGQRRSGNPDAGAYEQTISP